MLGFSHICEWNWQNGGGGMSQVDVGGIWEPNIMCKHNPRVWNILRLPGVSSIICQQSTHHSKNTDKQNACLQVTAAATCSYQNCHYGGSNLCLKLTLLRERRLFVQFLPSSRCGRIANASSIDANHMSQSELSRKSVKVIHFPVVI